MRRDPGLGGDPLPVRAEPACPVCGRAECDCPEYARHAETMRRYRRDHYDTDEPTGP